MEKQKICIIGDGLTGLTAALILSLLDIKIDLICKSKGIKKFNDNRTTAISESNYSFLSNCLNNTDLGAFWPCKNIDLYHEKLNQYYHFMNFENDGKNLMRIVEKTSIHLQI